MNTTDAKRILETALICSQQPVPVRDLRVLFEDALSADSIKALLAELQQDCEPGTFEQTGDETWHRSFYERKY